MSLCEGACLSPLPLSSLLGKLLAWAERREQWGLGKLLLGHFLSCQKLQRDSESRSLQGQQILGACVPAPGIGFMMPTFRSDLVPVSGPERLLTCCPEGRPRSLDGDLGRVHDILTSGAPSRPGQGFWGLSSAPSRLGRPPCTWHTDIYRGRIQAQLPGPNGNHRVSGSRLNLKLDEPQSVTPNQSQWAKTGCLMLSSGTFQDISGLRPLLGSGGCPHTGFLHHRC